MRSGTLAVCFCLLFACAGALAQALPAGFNRSDPITGRALPTGVYFAHDGRVFVPEKSGLIYVYQNLLDANPQVFVDLREVVHDYWDRGLLGFALDPRFPEQPYVYVQYAYNGGLFPGSDPVPWEPRWPSCPANNPFCGVGGGTDDCPDPPGATNPGGGCVISGHVSRLEVTGNTAGNELVLVEDWYQQFPSHSIGTIKFGPDGYLYAGGGDGASFNYHDLGQTGNADWPDERSPVNEGGSLRSQGLEDEPAYTDQVWLDGSISRIDPATGAGVPGNPLFGGSNTANAQRIIAYGFRNPFRFTFRPGTGGELWMGDVGENAWEEINVIPALPTSGNGTLKNFGWPCYKGRGHHDGFSGPICNRLYSGNDTGGRTPQSQPWYTYDHSHGSSDVTGLAFYEGTSYPAQYQNSLFFADNSRTIIFNVPYADANEDGIPDPPTDNNATAFFGGANATAVYLTMGPGGDLFFANINNGKISRISYCADHCSNQSPSAAIALDAGSTADGAPRTIAFTAANSIDPNAGDALTYDWDLDGDGTFGDASGVTASRFYPTEGSYLVAVRVSDQAGASDVQSMLVTVTGNANVADVGVTLDDGIDAVLPNDAITYTLTVTNHGTDTVPGEGVTSAFATQLASIAWTCTPSGGATCAASGSGDIDDLVDLPAGASVTYTIEATVASDASGTVSSSATITAPADYFDPNPADDQAIDADEVIDDRIFADGFE